MARLTRDVVRTGPPRRTSQQRKTVLLIGTTGSGKSTLGNCLLYPNTCMQVFYSSRDNKPETQFVQFAAGHFSPGAGKPPIQLEIIDTPGLNEDAEVDQLHKCEIKAVQKAEDITACILCVKFGSPIDTQYRETVRQYKELLPRLFQGKDNVIVVFTDYSMNPYAVRKREKSNYLEEAYERNAVEEIVQAGELPCAPKYFCIDSLPMMEVEHEVEYTMQARKAIFEHIDMCSVQYKTVLLIGSTGSGKSTLGNCLLGCTKKSQEVFAIGHDCKPKTQKVEIGCRRCYFSCGAGSSIPLEVIDTPGLNVSKAEDIQHMIEIVETVRKAGEIRACMLCVKFDSPINAKYTAMVRYYKELLSYLFETNVIIVFTDYSENMYEVKKRKRAGIDPAVVTKNAIEEIVRNGQLPYSPVYFAIDSLPFMEEDEKVTALTREAIINYIDSLCGVQTEDMPKATYRKLYELQSWTTLY